VKRGLPRTLVALGAALSALLVVEIGFRAFEPAPPQRPHLVAADGRIVDLGEVIRFFRDGDLHVTAEHVNGIKPSFHARLCYDRPALPYFDADGCVDVSINALGFRDEEFPLAKPAGEYRVLAIGDSFTFAQGCRAADGWTEVLEDRLAARRGGPVQVMNAGFTGGGSWPPEYAPWVLAHALAFEPDRVIYGMCLNDMDRRVRMLAYESVWTNPSLAPKPWLGGASAVLDRLLLNRRQRELEANAPKDFSLILAADPSQWTASRAAILAMRDHLTAAGVPFTIAVFPMLSELGDAYPYAGLHRAVADFCAAEHIDTVDLYAPFRGLDDKRLWVHPFDQHPNPIAQRTFAEGIFTHLPR
jgi:hypothetical protein